MGEAKRVARVGVDVDGVLADFNAGYRRRLCEVTGRDLFPPGYYAPTEWHYPNKSLGYTADEIGATWESIKADRMFWLNLKPLPGAQALITALLNRPWQIDVYFITARPGIKAKRQTERWLANVWNYYDAHVTPTVLIASGSKGNIAEGLRLTHFIDDRPDNCEAVATCGICVGTYLYTTSWNRDYDSNGIAIQRIDSLRTFTTHILEYVDGHESAAA